MHVVAVTKLNLPIFQKNVNSLATKNFTLQIAIIASASLLKFYFYAMDVLENQRNEMKVQK